MLLGVSNGDLLRYSVHEWCVSGDLRVVPFGEVMALVAAPTVEQILNSELNAFAPVWAAATSATFDSEALVTMDRGDRSAVLFSTQVSSKGRSRLLLFLWYLIFGTYNFFIY